MTILEADINAKRSRTARRTTIEDDDIQELLKIEDYTMVLPNSWRYHGVTRLIMYIHSSISFRQIEVEQGSEDLATISVEVGAGK